MTGDVARMFTDVGSLRPCYQARYHFLESSPDRMNQGPTNRIMSLKYKEQHEFRRNVNQTHNPKVEGSNPSRNQLLYHLRTEHLHSKSVAQCPASAPRGEVSLPSSRRGRYPCVRAYLSYYPQESTLLADDSVLCAEPRRMACAAPVSPSSPLWHGLSNPPENAKSYLTDVFLSLDRFRISCESFRSVRLARFRLEPAIAYPGVFCKTPLLATLAERRFDAPSTPASLWSP